MADCAGEYCSQVYVQQIYIEAASNIWIQTTGTETNLSCVPDSGIYLQLDGAAVQKKEVLALLMMAYSMDKLVTIRAVTGARGCAISYAFVDKQ